MTSSLQGLTSIVTGGGQGIGRAVAQVFAAAGSRVLVATRTEKSGQTTVDLIRAAGGDAQLLVVDFDSRAASQATIDAALQHFGQLDIVVHNAAAFPFQRIEDLSDEALDKTLTVNLKTAFWLAQLSLPYLKKSKQRRLLFTSSVTGPRTAIPGLAHYGASKAGLNGFIRSAALEFASAGITVNGVEPGLIRTPAIESHTDEERFAQMAAMIPVGKLGDPEDIAEALLFLASAQAKFITGQTIIADGGALLVENPGI
jgi:3-oxoacyl-[acyl-carrier protein] reductase